MNLEDGDAPFKFVQADDTPEPPFWFITIKYCGPDESPTIDIGELDPWHALGLLKAAAAHIHDCLPEFESSFMCEVAEDNDDE